MGAMRHACIHAQTVLENLSLEMECKRLKTQKRFLEFKGEKPCLKCLRFLRLCCLRSMFKIWIEVIWFINCHKKFLKDQEMGFQHLNNVPFSVLKG